MSTSRQSFEYAVVRLVPRVERGEFVNAGVLLHCQGAGFLGARTHVDEARLRALDSDVDVEAVRAALSSLEDACGAAASEPVAGMRLGQRFRWLTAPRSTVVQTGPVHTGLTDGPEAELDRLMALLVR